MDDIYKVVDNGGFVKAHWPKFVGGALVLVALLSASFWYKEKQTVKSLRTEIETASQEGVSMRSEISSLTTRVSSLNETINSDRSKNIKKLTLYGENGNKLREEYESQSQYIDSVVRQAEEKLEKIETELVTVLAENVTLKKELSLAFEKETIKRGGGLVGGGLSWTGAPYGLIQKTLLGPLGVAGMASFSTVPFGLSGGAALVTLEL